MNRVSYYAGSVLGLIFGLLLGILVVSMDASRGSGLITRMLNENPAWAIGIFCSEVLLLLVYGLHYVPRKTKESVGFWIPFFTATGGGVMIPVFATLIMVMVWVFVGLFAVLVILIWNNVLIFIASVGIIGWLLRKKEPKPRQIH